MSIIRIGLSETDKFSEGWEAIFGKKKTGQPKKAKASSAKKTKTSKAKKKSGKKK